MVNDYRLRKSISLYATNDILSRNHFTRQSLHFNKHGKQVLGNKHTTSRTEEVTETPQQNGSIECHIQASNITFGYLELSYFLYVFSK